MSPVKAEILTALAQEYARRYPEEATQALVRQPIRELVPFFEKESVQSAVTLLERLSPETAAQAVSRMNESVLRKILPALDPARAAMMLSRLEDTDRSRLFALMDPRVSGRVRSIIEYPQDSAGSLMDPQTMIFYPYTTVREVLSRIRQIKRKRIHDIIVADAQGRLLGMVPLQDIATASFTEQLDQLYQQNPTTVHAMTTKEEVVELMEQNKFATLPVVDFEGRILGVIRHNALVAAAQEEVSADIQTMVGASKEERALSRGWFAVRKRLPWLQINLGTAFLAASVVGLFENTIAQFTALAVLLPVVAGQSGNTGAQALAVTMRGLVLREIRVYQWPRVFLKELNVGFVNGCAVALTTSLAVYIWSRSAGLALVIGVSMVFSMVAAGLSGMAIPMLLTTLGQDPAQSSSIILTTVTDVVGFFSFLGLATLLSGLL